MANILVVDDEMGIRELLREILDDEGHQVSLAENAASARAAKAARDFDLILLDIWMPDTDGVTLLKEWVRADDKLCPVVMMSGHATIDTAVEATRLGATDFLEKPISMGKLLQAVGNGLAKQHKAVSGQAAAMAMPAAVTAPIVNTAPAAKPEALQPALSAWQHRLATVNLQQPMRAAREQFEKIYLEYHLHHTQCAITRIAELSGLERTHLYRKLKQLDIEIARPSKGEVD